METVTNLIFFGSKTTADGDCSHEIERCLFLGRKAMTNLDSILKSKDITLLTKMKPRGMKTLMLGRSRINVKLVEYLEGALMATHSSFLAWRIPLLEEPGRLSPQDCKESDMTE